jgi:dolichol-phosphate mannosyltransferase
MGGLGRAYLAGFKWALERDYQYVFEMDADFSHQPGYLPGMLAAAREGADLVVGSRYVAGGGTTGWGWQRKLISRGGGMYARAVLGLKPQDVTAGFVCFRRRVLEALELGEVFSLGFGFQVEMKYRTQRKGFSIVEVPIVFPDRTRGAS